MITWYRLELPFLEKLGQNYVDKMERISVALYYFPDFKPDSHVEALFYCIPCFGMRSKQPLSRENENELAEQVRLHIALNENKYSKLIFGRRKIVFCCEAFYNFRNDHAEPRKNEKMEVQLGNSLGTGPFLALDLSYNFICILGLLWYCRCRKPSSLYVAICPSQISSWIREIYHLPENRQCPWKVYFVREKLRIVLAKIMRAPILQPCLHNQHVSIGFR